MKISRYPIWNKENEYKKYDIVQYIGALYAALSDVPSGVEINNTSKWLMIYKNGALTNHERYQGLLIEQASETGGGTVDQTFDATSTNAQSGTAVDEALKGFFSIKGANNDNLTVAAGARVNTTIQIVPSDQNAQIAGFKRVFINNATDGGVNRDKIALQSMSTGGGGKQANIAIINTGSDAAKIKVEVECLCMNNVI